MIISVNWLKQYVDIDMPIDELVTLIGARLVEVEGTKDLREKYKDVHVVRIISCEKVEGSDHLSLLWIDDGGAVNDIERNTNGFIQVVCGAPNVRADQLVAWLPPQSIVPETFESDDPFVLSARPLMGHVSNGMIASARELDLYDEHDGILEVDKDVAPGASFAEVYELNDVLIDIENKSLTHRPDAFGIIGFAREVAGIQGRQFVTPDWLADTTRNIGVQTDIIAPAVKIEDAALSERFQMIVLDGVSESSASPVLLQTYLARSGVRPINAMVDISNYLMLLTGQPTHMYDYDKLKAVSGDDFTVGVRQGRSGETLILLDGKRVELDEADIVITAGGTAVGLAGIMGGESTATDESTKIVALEVATFDLYRMRSSQMRHGIFSEAVTRYTKGVPSELGRPVLNRAVQMTTELIGGMAASDVIDAYPGKKTDIQIPIESEQVNKLLGTRFSAEDIALVLDNVGFKTVFNAELEGIVTVPYWRNDIHISEDIIEEVGRLTGFDSIDATMPLRDFTAVLPSRFDEVRRALRASLVRAGLSEVLTYSFVHGDLIARAGQNPNNSYKVVNSISPELQYYRQSLTPSILQHANPNIRLGYEQFGLFEFNKVHQKSAGVTDEGVPVEYNSVAAVIVDAKKSVETPYYQAKYILEYMLKRAGIAVRFVPLNTDIVGPEAAVFEPSRSALVVADNDGAVLGVVGEYTRTIRKVFKLPEYAAGFELSVDALVGKAPLVATEYRSISKYPGTERDVCFRVKSEVMYQQLYDAAIGALSDSEFEWTISPLDIYAPEDEGVKNITIKIALTSHTRTLTSQEAAESVGRVIDSVVKAVDAEVV